MNLKLEVEIAVRNELIASLEWHNKIQNKLIREQNIMIKTLEYQNLELQKLLEQILKA